MLFARLIGSATCRLSAQLQAIAAHNLGQLIKLAPHRFVNRFKTTLHGFGSSPKRQGIHREEARVLLVGLEENDIPAKGVVGQITLNPQFQPRMQKGSENLIGDQFRAAPGQIVSSGAIH